MADETYLPIDLGASGGRVLAGCWNGETLRLEEVSRFSNGGIPVRGRLYWDVLGIWQEVLGGLRKAQQDYGHQIKSVGVDTWGVDFCLLDRQDALLANPRTYRDRHTTGVMVEAFKTLSREEIFAETGLQFMEFNTLYQLIALREADSPLFDVAEKFLMMPDYFHWLLSGEISNELTNSSTTQFYNPTSKTWSEKLLETFQIPQKWFGPLSEPGTNLGNLTKEVAHETGLQGVNVVLPGTHDTASAVVAVPADSVPGEPSDWCYVSSGTWSLMGIETAEPILTEDVLKLNFTNEAGVFGTTRLLKNITGLWIVQECQRIWARNGRDFSWAELAAMAAKAPALESFIDPDHGAFASPSDMPQAIAEFCSDTGQKVPHEHDAFIRCAIDSLAMKQRYVLEGLEKLAGHPIKKIHVVGGGTQNELLCQATANATGRLVIAGPVEATAIGNLVMQAISAGSIGSLAEARQIVRKSFPTKTYEPQDAGRWEEAYEHFLTVTKIRN
ncbi:Carbohydrate kinase FGGY [Planctomycetales bacterium 10988]|nr:Carbohydrate kinase FGGY [Planctomycetales bacterium 10988]